ncbi:MAG: hypothetical protein JRH20_08000 [Deltaproteobacteria bacterium]|nr:hypothetical protein [Deltaproteobacteria bacterium]
MAPGQQDPRPGVFAGKADGADEAWQTTKLLAVANGLGMGDPHYYMEEIATYEVGLTDQEYNALSFLKDPITSRGALEALVGQAATVALDTYARGQTFEDHWTWLTRIALGDEYATTGVKVWGQLSTYSDMTLSAQPNDQIALRLVRFCEGNWNPRIDLWGGSVDLSVNPSGNVDVEIPAGAFVAGKATTAITLDVDELDLNLENRGGSGYFMFEIQCVGGPCLQKPSTHDRWAFLFDEASMRTRTCAGVTPALPPEADDATCSDGIDNDGDGYVDCADYGCGKNPLVTVWRRTTRLAPTVSTTTLTAMWTVTTMIARSTAPLACVPHLRHQLRTKTPPALTASTTTVMVWWTAQTPTAR